MKNQVTIREAVTENDVAIFWEQLYAYFRRDMFGPEGSGLDFVLGARYRQTIESIHNRPQNRLRYLFFHRDGQDIGFAMPVIYTAEDGKCFIMEYCVYPEFRGNGAGTECAKVLLEWTKHLGAQYWELNCDDVQRQRFWARLGFQKNGLDDQGDPVMLLPPKEDISITVEILSDPEDWQLKKLENSFLQEIGEEMPPQEKYVQLAEAIRDGKITFFVAKRGCRAVGMCSVAKCFSTFSCADIGVFDDFYIEPVFRKKGIARMLTQAAQKWSKENGLASLTVTCAPCDERMYQSLGFDMQLGTTFAHIR